MLSADYIVGLTDGEGSFCVFIRKPIRATWHNRVECHFYIKMREDELPLLRKVNKFFRCGRIAFQKEYRKNQRDNYRYQVSNLSELQRAVIPFFSSHGLHSQNRKRDFQIFQKIVSMVAKRNHRHERGMEKIAKLKSQMHQ